jgi:hypothetical protein
MEKSPYELHRLTLYTSKYSISINPSVRRMVTQGPKRWGACKAITHHILYLALSSISIPLPYRTVTHGKSIYEFGSRVDSHCIAQACYSSRCTGTRLDSPTWSPLCFLCFLKLVGADTNNVSTSVGSGSPRILDRSPARTNLNFSPQISVGATVRHEPTCSLSTLMKCCSESRCNRCESGPIPHNGGMSNAVTIRHGTRQRNEFCTSE